MCDFLILFWKGSEITGTFFELRELQLAHSPILSSLFFWSACTHLVPWCPG